MPNKNDGNEEIAMRQGRIHKRYKYTSRLLAFVLVATMVLQVSSGSIAVAAEEAGDVAAVGTAVSGDALQTARSMDGNEPGNTIADDTGTQTGEPVTTTQTPPTTTESTVPTTQQPPTTEAPLILDTAYSLFNVTTSGTSIKIGWFVQNNTASGYTIFRKDNYKKDYKKIGEVAGGQSRFNMYYFQDSGLKRGVKYTYKVEPFHVRNDGSVVNGTVSNTTSYAPSFLAPVISSSTRSGKTITLKWKKVAGADGYEIYQAQEKGGYKKVKTISGGGKTSVKLNKKNPNKDYRYKVKAYTKYASNRIFSKASEVIKVYSNSIQKILNKIAKLKKKYPTGKYWNLMEDPNGDSETISDTPCMHNVYGYRYCNRYYCPNGVLGLQCYGFAWKMSDLIYGRDAKIKNHKSYSKAKVGDVIRYSGHSVIIIEKHKDYIRVGECNAGGTCIILWGRKVKKSELKNATYSHRYY